MTFTAADTIPETDAALEKLLGYLDIEINQDARAVLWNTLSEYVTEIGCLRAALEQAREVIEAAREFYAGYRDAPWHLAERLGKALAALDSGKPSHTCLHYARQVPVGEWCPRCKEVVRAEKEAL